MKLKRILPLVIALVLVLAFAACGSPAYNNGDGYTTTELPTLAPDEMFDFSPVFVDGENVSGAQILRGEDYWPTHVELVPVLQALGLAHTWDEVTGEVTIGEDITFIAGQGADTVLEDGVLYVSLTFVRNVLQVPGVSVESGEVHIRTHAVESDMF